MTLHQPIPARQSINPITAEVIRHALLSIPNQIDVNLTRTAFSPLVYEYKDYAVGIVDHEGRLICQSNGGIPILVANALGVAVQDGIAVHGLKGIHPGDVIISNHAGTIGQHLNNVVMYTPIFVGPDQSELFGFMGVLLHWIDVGGSTVGSCFSTSTTEIFQEGIQFRSIKLWARGEPRDDIYRMIECNTRFPRMVLGDCESQLAGCLLGRDRLVELIGKYGIRNVRAAVETMWTRSEQATRAAIRAMPDGRFTSRTFLDSDGINPGRTIPIILAVEINGDEITVDFSEIADQIDGPMNSGKEGGAVTAARVALRYLIEQDEPPNEGTFRPMHIRIPDGKFMSATGNTALGAYSASLATVIDCIQRALVEAAPDRLAAGHHGTMGTHAWEGYDPRHQDLFSNLESSHGGWGASLGHDGYGPYKTMSHGDTRDVPIEVQEALYPLLVEYCTLRGDSGGAGTFRGGLGVDKLTRATAPCRIRTNIERHGDPAWGVLGGSAGAPPCTSVIRAGSEAEPVLKGMVDLKPGDKIHMQTGGGGGYGNPRDRSRDRVIEDVRQGYVSLTAAADQYGVVLEPQEIGLKP